MTLVDSSGQMMNNIDGFYASKLIGVGAVCRSAF
jgi:hypothetical protein